MLGFIRPPLIPPPLIKPPSPPLTPPPGINPTIGWLLNPKDKNPPDFTKPPGWKWPTLNPPGSPNESSTTSGKIGSAYSEIHVTVSGIYTGGIAGATPYYPYTTREFKVDFPVYTFGCSFSVIEIHVGFVQTAAGLIRVYHRSLQLVRPNGQSDGIASTVNGLFQGLTAGGSFKIRLAPFGTHTVGTPPPPEHVGFDPGPLPGPVKPEGPPREPDKKPPPIVLPPTRLPKPAKPPAPRPRPDRDPTPPAPKPRPDPPPITDPKPGDPKPKRDPAPPARPGKPPAPRPGPGPNTKPKDEPDKNPLPNKLPDLHPQTGKISDTRPGQVKTTPKDQHLTKDGPVVGNGPAPNLEEIARELGRQEQKLTKLLDRTTPAGGGPLDLGDLLMLLQLIYDLLSNTTDGATYSVTAPCTEQGEDEPRTRSVQIPDGLNRETAAIARLDAIAYLLQEAQLMTVKTCNRNTRTPGNNVTVTAFEVVQG